MNNPYRVLGVDAKALSNGAINVAVGLRAANLRLFSNRKFHFAIGEEATTDSTPVNADTAEFIGGLSPTDTVSVILADGETDGKIWATSIARS